MWERPCTNTLAKCLTDPKKPIAMRMRAAYFFRQIHDEIGKNEVGEIKTQKEQDVINILIRGLINKQHGSLMRHEIAYIMGQLRDNKSCVTLEQILMDDDDCVMVRHEAAEALGAIGSANSESVLELVMDRTVDSIQELSETCRVALDFMRWKTNGSVLGEMPAVCACMLSPYSSVDPAPIHPSHTTMTAKELGNTLNDGTLSIFERYRAMFSLRNMGGSEAVSELCKALVHDTTSALLRHEVAYVLGQMQHSDSVEALEQSLRRINEHNMVRHESAEALGAIEGRWEDVKRILMEFSHDCDDVVRESCIVALDAADYWGYNTNKCDVSDGGDEAPSHELNKESFAIQKSEQRVLVNHFNIKQ